MRAFKCLFAAVLFSMVSTAFAHRVTAITDGDSIELFVNGVLLKIRLANIDAPERRQPYGQQSKNSLSDLCWGKKVVFEKMSTDRYGRLIAKVFCDGVDVSLEQIRRGFAWIYTKYNDDNRLLIIEDMARREKRGLWVDHEAVAPWLYRRRKN